MAGTVKKLYLSEGVSVTAPTDLSFAALGSYASDAAWVAANGTAYDGAMYVNTTLQVVRYYASAAWRSVVSVSDASDPTKRLAIDVTGNTTGVTATLDFNATANRTYTYPDVAGTVVLSTALPASLDVEAAGAVTIGASVGANNLTLGGATSTVVVPGNLTVSGTTVTVDVTNLEVEDKNININNGGNDASSEGAGLNVERTSTHGSMIYAAAATSRWKAGDAGAEVEIATISGAQVITNKDIDGGTASNTSRLTVPKAATATLTALTRKEGTIVFDTDLDKPYYDNGTSLVAFGSGSGSGGINYLSNADFEDSVTGWTTYADAAAATPVDGTGGSPNVTFTRNTTTPLSGNADGKFSKDAVNRQGQGVAALAAVPRAYVYGQKSQISFAWDGTHANYVAGDIVCYVYDVTNSVLITPTATALPKAKQVVSMAWDQSGTGASYRLIFHVATVNAALYDVYVDDVTFGPGEPQMGAVVGDWLSYTPTGAWTTNTTYEGKWRRVGDTMQIQGYVALGGAPVGDTNFTFSIPSGYTINTSALTTIAVRALGTAITRDGGTRNYPGVVNYASTTTVGIVHAETTGNTESGLQHDSPFTYGAGDNINLEFWVPIAEWAGSGTFSGQNNVEYASNSGTWDATDTTSFAYGPAGAATTGSLASDREKTVQFLTPIQSTDILSLEVSDDGTNWSELTGNRNATVGTITALTGGVSTNYGAGLKDGATNSQAIVYFGRYCGPGGTWDGAGRNWSTGLRWRVKKTSGGQAVGFGIASEGASGLINNYQEGTQASTFTWNGSGGTSSSNTMVITRVGRAVTLFIPETVATSGTGSSTITANTALPTWARPAQTVAFFGVFRDGAARGAGGFGITTGGILSFGKPDGASFTNSTANQGWNGNWSVSYYV